MLSRIKSALSVVVGETPKKPDIICGEVIVRGRKFSANAIDAQRVVVSCGRDEFFARQKFAFQMSVQGLDRRHPFVGVGLVERIDDERATIVYKIEGTAHRQLVAAFLEHRDMTKALRALATGTEAGRAAAAKGAAGKAKRQA